ncbi:hypothetical protein [uncultured Microbacterium sp.]|uniref:hypothetical protein n=1 Tax=uncultured Microbacterium sp. TaxID=191216 RepID=UPI0025F01C3E|nr:hypothetical protein [uncultured Microbacterium sp.]
MPSTVGLVLLGTVTLAALSLSGCVQSRPSGTDDSAPASESADESMCELLDSATVASLIDEAPEGREFTIPGSTLEACEFGALEQSGVQVSQQPADEWAQSLPSLWAQLKATADSRMMSAPSVSRLDDAVRRIESGRHLDATEACTYFSDLLAIQGQDAGSNMVVFYLPNKPSAIAVSGQSCQSGVFTSVVVGRQDLAELPDMADRVGQILNDLN